MVARMYRGTTVCLKPDFLSQKQAVPARVIAVNHGWRSDKNPGVNLLVRLNCFAHLQGEML